MTSSPDGLAPGTAVHRYIVVDEIGRGGMGTVYGAWDPDLGRRVALKLLHRFEGHDARDRLFAEARALARLRHPNVVTIHDVGEFGERVFLAMDFVQGQTLRRWLGRPRPRREVLAVLMQAGRGLAAAHDAGLVHGDFKPDNILVETTGQMATARVIDFGLAFATDGTERSTATGHQGLPWAAGTPAYMAPELFLGARPGGASDQWSFAQVCVEALSGRRGGGEDGSPRAEGTGRIRRALAQALAEDPTARFTSVAGLLHALERSQTQGRWLGLGVVTVAVAVLIATVARRDSRCSGGDVAIAGIWNDDARTRLDAAIAASAQAAPAVAAVLGRTLDAWTRDWAATHRDLCLAVQVRRERSTEFLDAAMACLDDGRASLATLLAEGEAGAAPEPWKLVDLATALPRPQRCASPPRGVEITPEAGSLRAELGRGRTRLALGDPAQAQQIARDVAQSAAEAGLARVAAEASLLRGEVALEAADYPAASAALAAALSAGIDVDAPDLVARVVLQQLVLEGVRRAADAQADALLPFAQAYVHRSADPLLTAQLQYARGSIARRRERYEEAQDHCSASAELVAKSDGPERARWAARMCVADMAASLGDLDRAAAEYQSIRAEMQTRFGPSYPMIAGTLQGEGKLALDRRDLAGAQVLWSQALAMVEQIYGPTHERAAGLLANLAVVAGAQGDRDAERSLLQRAIDRFEGIHGPEHPDVAQAHSLLGASYLETQDFAAARQRFERALAALDAGAALDETRAVILANIGMTWVGEANPDQARPWLERALESLQRGLGPEHWRVGAALVELGECELMASRFAQALLRLREAERLWQGNKDLSPLKRARLALRLSQALHETGATRKEVRRYGEHARELLRASEGDTTMQREEVEAWLGELGPTTGVPRPRPSGASTDPTERAKRSAGGPRQGASANRTGALEWRGAAASRPHAPVNVTPMNSPGGHENRRHERDE